MAKVAEVQARVPLVASLPVKQYTQHPALLLSLTCSPTSTQSSSVCWKNLVAARLLNRLRFFRLFGGLRTSGAGRTAARH